MFLSVILSALCVYWKLARINQVCQRAIYFSEVAQFAVTEVSSDYFNSSFSFKKQRILEVLAMARVGIVKAIGKVFERTEDRLTKIITNKQSTINQTKGNYYETCILSTPLDLAEF